ncbi:thermonuclease family protein [Acidovorax sp. Root219]|uniref:thermonuclease family protein n=1 Tax=Acidovorax sp. Root219 TaxID=1736493 RepID=UPI000709B00C|nr:thermonuclease family protein [Acidovorax sp. Root219]
MKIRKIWAFACAAVLAASTTFASAQEVFTSTVLPEATGGYAIILGTGAYTQAKVCTAGKPCGNTCISKTYTCHVGTTPVTPVLPVTPVQPVTPPVVVTPPVTPPVAAIPEKAVKPKPATCDSAQVLRVVDGDTLVVAGSKGTEKIRIGQIDAPEKSQAYGPQATACLVDLVANKQVSVCRDGSDRYGRTIANLLVGNTDVASQLVAKGCAWAYDKYLEAQSTLPAQQDQARASSLGLWASNSTAPWVYRGGSAPVPVLASGKTAVTVTTTTSARTPDRVLDWAELKFDDLLRNGSSSIPLGTNGAYRCYESGLCVGTMDGSVLLYDGRDVKAMGNEADLLKAAEAEGF